MKFGIFVEFAFLSHLAVKGLSNDVFEQCISTGSAAFSTLICLDANYQMRIYVLNFLHL